MIKWEKVKLEDVCNILDAQRIPITASAREHGQYPYYGANGIQDYVSDYIFNGEFVLIAEDGGNFGSKTKPIAYRVSGKCWVNNHAHVLSAKSNINIDYLCYSLMFYDVSKIISGTTRAKLNQAALRKMEIHLPPLEEQHKIASILDTVSEALKLRKQQLKELDLLVKSKFIEMFGDPVTNEKNWEIDKLGKLGELNRGVSKHRPRNDASLLNGAYPLIQTGEVSNTDLYIKSYKNTYSELGLKQSRLWKSGTLCITIAANIAQTSILTFDACFPDSIVGFNSYKKTNQIFIHFWFSFFQRILEEQAPYVAQKNINLKILNNLNVIVPPIELQNKFASFVQHVDKLKSEVQKSIDQLQTLFDSLMQQYFE